MVVSPGPRPPSLVPVGARERSAPGRARRTSAPSCARRGRQPRRGACSTRDAQRASRPPETPPAGKLAGGKSPANSPPGRQSFYGKMEPRRLWGPAGPAGRAQTQLGWVLLVRPAAGGAIQGPGSRAGPKLERGEFPSSGAHGAALPGPVIRAVCTCSIPAMSSGVPPYLLELAMRDATCSRCDL